MDENAEIIIEIAGKKHKYQYFIVTVTFFCWFCFELISVSLSFLEMMPYVKYTLENGTSVEARLNNTICDKYNYTVVNHTSHSWVIEFDKECNKVETGLIGTFAFFGVLIGALIFQLIAEKLGRRYAIIIAGGGYICWLIAFQFANSIYYVWILSVFLQVFSSIGNLGSYLLMNEITSVDSRSVCGAIVQSAFSVSGTLFIGLYYYLDSWRIPFIVAASVALINVLLYYIFGFESPRYYLNQNNLNDFFLTLAKMAKFNGKELEFSELVLCNYDFPQNYYTQIPKPHSLESLSNNDLLLTKNDEGVDKIIKMKEIIHKMKELSEIRIQKANLQRNQVSCFSLLKYKSQRLNFLIMCYMWFCTSGVYYGLTINIKNLPGNTYITGIVMFFIEAIAYIVSGYFINIAFLGRKNTIFMFYSISFIVFGIILLFNVSNYWLTILSLSARFCVSGVYNIIYTYSTEVYPTVVRSNGLGFNSVCGRVGGMVFPFILEVLHDSITYLFMGLNLLALIAVMILPETYGKTLTDSIPEDIVKVTQKN